MKENNIISKIVLIIILFILPYTLHADVPRAIYTPNGTSVGDSRQTTEDSSSTRAYWDSYYSNAYPNAIQIKLWGDNYSSSRRYNCHGYAWYMIGENKINDPVWIGYYNYGKTYKYWQDESYTAVSESNATHVNYSEDHSAVTTSHPNYYISKWNKYPLVRHHKNYCPSGYGNPQGFYKRAPAPSINISGPFYVPIGQSGTFTANTNGYQGAYDYYKWWYRNDGDEFKGVKAPPVGIWFHNDYWDNKKSITAGFGFNFSLKCTASNNGSNTATDIHSVIVGYSKSKASSNESIMVLKAAIPIEFVLNQNHPNPFNPVTSISFGLPESAKVIMTIYSVTGQKVKTLFDGQLSAGYHQLQWDGTDPNGNKVTSGVYLYHISATSNNSDKVYSEKRKMILMK